MNLIHLKYREDFGHDVYLQLFNTGKHFPRLLRKRSLFQFSLSWNDYPSWPYVQITFGNSGIFSFMFWVYKFGFDFDFCSYTWKMYREENNEETT